MRSREAFVDTSAEAESDHHGITDECNEMIAADRNWGSVKATKKSFQSKITQNMPATKSPGSES